MFRSKRNGLVKRLWKLRVLTEDETRGTDESPEVLEVKSVIHSVLKRLKEKQLECLISSLESKGGENTGCVLLPKGEIRIGRRTVQPQMMCCQIWRWPNVDHNHKLKRLTCCTSADDPGFTCCNPYHWSILLEPDSPPPPYTKAQSTPRLPPDPLPYTPVSTETGGTPSHFHNGDGLLSGSQKGSFWCNVAYWELRQRVGRLYTVCEPSVSIFQQLPHGDGMCLGILQNDSYIESVKRTREKIGFGLTLSKEEDGVWMYNRSAFPVFVNSPTLDLPNTRTFTVHKVLPGYSIKIFDYDRSRVIEENRDPQFLDGPYDPNAVRISFAKGWGPCYSRQFITSCPCWLEVLLTVKR